MSEIGPTRSDLTDLTIAEIRSKSHTGDRAQSMAEGLSPEQLRDKAANLRARIEQTEVIIAMAQDELNTLRWDLNEVSRAQQLADDRNSGI